MTYNWELNICTYFSKYLNYIKWHITSPKCYITFRVSKARIWEKGTQIYKYIKTQETKSIVGCFCEDKGGSFVQWFQSICFTNVSKASLHRVRLSIKTFTSSTKINKQQQIYTKIKISEVKINQNIAHGPRWGKTPSANKDRMSDEPTEILLPL